MELQVVLETDNVIFQRKIKTAYKNAQCNLCRALCDRSQSHYVTKETICDYVIR